jgi:hypothetical protein
MIDPAGPGDRLNAMGYPYLKLIQYRYSSP